MLSTLSLEKKNGGRVRFARRCHHVYRYIMLFATIHVNTSFGIQLVLLGLAVGFAHVLVLEDRCHVGDIRFDVAFATRFVARGGDDGQHEHCRN